MTANKSIYQDQRQLYAGRGLREALTVLIFVETSREFGRGLLHGIARYSRLHAHWRVYQRPVALDSSLPDWRDMKIDGAIARDVRVAQGLVRADFPVVFVQHSRDIYQQFPCLVTDAQAIATMGVEHLLERGFKKFAFCGYDEFIWSRNRCRFFTERITKEGLQVVVYTQPRSRTKRLWKNEQYILADWLTSLPKPIALMACNDDRALQVVEACKLTGIAVPEDVAVIGVDNDPIVCELADPPISSIALTTEAAGYAAAELLDRLMHGEPMAGQRIMVYPTHVVARVSTDITAVTDPEVAAAVCYIREHADKPIQVADVVRATAVSRRVLENRFRTALRRSIHQEIQRVRVNHIRQLLVDTDLSIKEIARRAGFDSPGHIARYFRGVTGVSLREYRHRYIAR